MIGLGFMSAVVVTALAAITVSNLKTFQAAQVVSAADINSNFSILRTAIEGVHEVPVGSITAWHKDFYTTAPTLPMGWVQADGQTITDADSPFVGKTLPDLNGGTRFLRGGATSGLFETDAFRAHNHSFTTTSQISTGWPASGYCAIHTTDRITGCSLGGGFPSVTNSALIHNNGGAETRPVNMSVVWIIKIK